MQRLTEFAIEQASGGIFTRAEVACWVGGSPQRQFSLVKRALASGEVVRLHRGLYCLAAKYLRSRIDPLVLAQRICGPSYISLETALSVHGWIPEAVYSITSVCLERSREFDTPLGHFSFTHVPQSVLYAEVTRIGSVRPPHACRPPGIRKDGTGYGSGCGSGGGFADGSGYGGGPGVPTGESFLLASPLKALADYVYVHKADWTSARPVIESLRVDEGSLVGIDRESCDRLASNYSSVRVRRFLAGLAKDWKR